MKVVPIAILALFLPAAAAKAQTWSELGGSATDGGVSSSPKDSAAPVVAVDSLGNPVVAWLESYQTSNLQVHLRRWDGQGWVQLAGSATNKGVSNALTNVASFSMTLDGSGHPVVAWSSKTVSSGPVQILLRRWNPNSSVWEEVGGSASGGGISNTTTTSDQPSVALDSKGNLFVAWVESAQKPAILLRVWNPQRASWDELGGSGTSGISSGLLSYDRPRVAVGGTGKPAVAWISLTQLFYASNVFLRQWNGQAWVGLDGSDTGNGVSNLPQNFDLVESFGLQADLAGHPVLAYQVYLDVVPPSFIYLRRWNGQAWIGLGGSASGGGINGLFGLPSPVQSVALQLDGVGQPVVAWAGSVGNLKDVYLARWNGSAWTGVLDSALPGGLSVTPEDSHAPSVSIGTNGDFHVAWQELVPDPGNPNAAKKKQIYLRTKPSAPPQLAAPAQLLPDGVTPIPPGGITLGSTGFVAAATGSDDDGDAMFLEIEVQATGVPFTNQATAFGPPNAGPLLSVDVTGLVLGTSYRWQARTVDSTGKASPWTDFGSDDLYEADFIARDNDPPDGVLHSVTVTSTGAPVGSGTPLISLEDISFSGIPSDPDDDVVRIEIEMRGTGVPFTGQPTSTGGYVAPGQTSTAVAKPAKGTYAVRYRFADPYAGGTGPWLDYGQQLVIQPAGSSNAIRGGCGSSSRGSLTFALPALFLALLWPPAGNRTP